MASGTFTLKGLVGAEQVLDTEKRIPLGPSPDFYCETCDVFDFEPHDGSTCTREEKLVGLRDPLFAKELEGLDGDGI